MSGDSSLFESVLASLSDGVMTIDRDGRIVTFNKAAGRILGLSPDQVVGQPFAAVFFAKAGNEEFIQAVLDAVYESTLLHETTIPYVRGKDRLLLEVKTSLLQSRDGDSDESSAMVVIIRDVTEVSRLAEEEHRLAAELKTSQRRFADIIEFLPDPAFAVDLEGKVTIWNRALERMTGATAAEMLGKGNLEYAVPFYGERRPVLIDLVSRPVEEVVARYSNVRREGDALLAEGFAPIPKRQGVWFEASATHLRDGDGRTVGAIETFRDVTRRKHAEEELSAKHSELQEAFLRIEQSNEELQTALKKVQVLRIAASLTIILLFVGIGFYVTWGQFRGKQPARSERPAIAEVVGTLVVQPTLLQETVALTGSLRPLRVVNVTSPFNGKIAQRLVAYGEAVEKGQPLAVLDTSEVLVKRREAEISLIKAEESLEEIRGWADGSEVANARRSLARAQMSLDTQKQALAEAERLFNKGIIAASEHDNARVQAVNAEMDFESAKDALTSALARGGANNLRIAELEVENARRGLGEIEAQLALAEIRSPVSGTVIMTDAGEREQKGKPPERGVSFSQGEVVFSIGDTGGLSAAIAVDEVEVAKLKVGQTAKVTGEAFPGVTLSGEVEQVSTQAVVLGGGSRKPMFEVVIAIPELPAEARKKIRLGMSAAIEILLFAKPEALLVPAEAVESEGGQYVVWRVDPATRELQRTPVTLGLSTLDAVEVAEGLQAGDTVALRRR